MTKDKHVERAKKVIVGDLAQGLQDSMSWTLLRDSSLFACYITLTVKQHHYQQRNS